jgi:hypothetical protein
VAVNYRLGHPSGALVEIENIAQKNLIVYPINGRLR